MPDTRTRYIGARFTEKEKENIQEIAKKTNQTISELFREAIFSHINFLRNNHGNLEKIEMWVVKQDADNLSH
ncbi:hypothetical protein LCGC14_2217110 [marine sediment metagenome]|uniref:Uncharacterized protein n=1 Tax=marine sediment metagenome TaxID=412755 RepID=A0A0F9DC40_9ZZZZ